MDKKAFDPTSDDTTRNVVSELDAGDMLVNIFIGKKSLKEFLISVFMSVDGCLKVDVNGCE